MIEELLLLKPNQVIKIIHREPAITKYRKVLGILGDLIFLSRLTTDKESIRNILDLSATIHFDQLKHSLWEVDND